MSSKHQELCLSRTECIALACPVLLCILVTLRPLTDFDIGYHIRAGAYFLGPGGWPTPDPFAYSIPQESWVYESWLASVSYYLAFALGGIPATILGMALLYGGGIGLMVVATRRVSNVSWLISSTALIAVLNSAAGFRARPYVFSYVFFAAMVAMLLWLRTRNVPWSGLLLVPVFFVWPLFHPEYLTGLTVFGAFGIGAIAEVCFAGRGSQYVEVCINRAGLLRLVVIGAACAVAIVAALVCIHPTGLDSLERVLALSSSEFFRHNTNEVRPLWKNYGITWPTIVLFGGPVLIWLHRPRSLALPLIAVHLLLVFTTLRVGRMVSNASLAAIPVFVLTLASLAAALPDEVARKTNWLRRENVQSLLLCLPIALSLMLAIQHLGERGLRLEWDPRFYPQACFEKIDELDPQGNLWNDVFFGHSLVFHFEPRRKVFIDGRSIYTESFFVDDYYGIATARPDWQARVRRFGIELFVLHPTRHPRLHEALRRSADWTTVYEDPYCKLVRRSNETASSLPVKDDPTDRTG